jgi:hypothetical protein
MNRTIATLAVAFLLLLAFAWQSFSQAPPGFTGVYDAATGALRTTGGGGTGTLASASFGNGFPAGGIATGYQDSNGAFASATLTNGLPINLTSFGSTAVVTGTGTSGSGIPRVTVSSDSSLAAADASTGLTAMASSSTINVALAGQVGAVFQLASGGTGAYTVTPECSFDGGSTYPIGVQLTDPATGLDAPTATIISGQTTTPYTVVCPFGASHARLRVSSWTSGTASWTARATVGGLPNSVPTILNAGTVSGTNLATSVTLNAVSGQRVCINSIVLFGSAANGAASVTVTNGTFLIQMGVASLTVANSPVFFDGSPICGTSGTNMTVNIGAGGTGVITTTSVVGDRA